MSVLKSFVKEIFKAIASKKSGAEPESRPSSRTVNQLNLRIGDLMLKYCKYGWMLFSGPYIGKCFELYGEYSESEVSVLRAYLSEGDIAIDVGANIGDLTLPMARMVGDKGRIFAYDSHPSVFNVLCGNLALNQITNVKPVNAFVANDPSASTDGGFWGKNAYIGDTWEPTFVALDNLDIDRLKLIKIDVDGNELAVLKSGLRLIEAYQPVLYFENDVREKSEALLEFVLGLGYRIFFHTAPINQADNFFDNPVNHWHPNTIHSLMVIALPKHMTPPHWELREVTQKSEWW